MKSVLLLALFLAWAAMDGYSQPANGSELEPGYYVVVAAYAATRKIMPAVLQSNYKTPGLRHNTDLTHKKIFTLFT